MTRLLDLACEGCDSPKWRCDAIRPPAIKCCPNCNHSRALTTEAQRILDAAASQREIEWPALVEFARACLLAGVAPDETSRRALAVLDAPDSKFMPRRALELAAHVLKEGKGK